MTTRLAADGHRYPIDPGHPGRFASARCVCCAVVLTLVAGCGGAVTTTAPEGSPEASAPGADANARTDAPSETSTDAAPDAAIDVVLDASDARAELDATADMRSEDVLTQDARSEDSPADVQSDGYSCSNMCILFAHQQADVDGGDGGYVDYDGGYGVTVVDVCCTLWEPCVAMISGDPNEYVGTCSTP